MLTTVLMGRININTCLFFLLLVFFGCKKKVNPLHYINEVNKPEYELRRQKEINEHTFILSYEPKEKRILQRNNGLSKTDYEPLVSSINTELFFKFQIQPPNISETSSFVSSNIGYFSNDIRRNFFLVVNNKDTLNPSFLQFENTYGLTPFLTFLVSFEYSNKIEEMNFTYDDEIFKCSQLKFHYSSTCLKNLPVLDWD